MVGYRTTAFALSLALVGGCRSQPEDPSAKPATTLGPKPRASEAPSDPAGPGVFIYPADFTLTDAPEVEELEVTHFPEPVGPGYPRVRVQMSKPLYTGKWLGLTNGSGLFFGPRHVIVNVYRSKPSAPGIGDLDKNVLLDVESGQVSAEFGPTRDIQWHFGLAIVSMPDDKRPYLLDAETGTVTLAVPEGTHPYVYGRNYWLRLSPIAKRVWVLAEEEARDGSETVHLYAWDDLTTPPELPNNPFPFMPKDWDPSQTWAFVAADTEEVVGPDRGDCTRAVLMPPKGYVCLDEAWMQYTVPLSDGWRLDKDDGVVFNQDTGTGTRLSSICPKDSSAYVGVEERTPPRVQVACEGGPKTKMYWTPANGVRALPAEITRLEWTDFFIEHHHTTDRYFAIPLDPPGTSSFVNPGYSERALVGDDYPHETTVVSAGLGRSVTRDSDGKHELVDHTVKLRSHPFDANDVLIARRTGSTVARISRGSTQVIVRLELKP